jgi:uncharacterized protein (TIRG00374 family)
LPLRAGEAARILALVRRTKGTAAEATATVVLERALDVLSLVVLLLACTPWLPQLAWLKPLAMVAVSIVLVVAVAAWLLARFDDRPVELLLAPLRVLPGFDGARVAAAARAAADGLEALRSVSTALTCCVLTFASWFALSLSFWLLTFAFHLNVPFLAGVLVVVTTNLGQVIPSSPAGIGVFEAAALLALASYGVGRSSGLSYAVALHALNFVPYLLIGAIALRRTPVTRPEMKNGLSSPFGPS